jgi:uncharacterized protein YjbI with pentapeptide repeats
MSSLADQPDNPILAKLRAGEPLTFPAPPSDREETTEEIAARTIPANWVEDLAVRPSRIVGVPVVISNAIVDGRLDLQYARFEFGLSITNTTFKDEADFSFAVFKRTATFESSHFLRPASFRAAHAEADFRISRAHFADESTFEELQVKNALLALAAKFEAVNFDWVVVGGGAFFHSDAKGQRTTFGGDSRFFGAHIQGLAYFGGVEFNAKAIFVRMQIDGGAYFFSDNEGQRVRFAGETAFVGSRIQGDIDFSGAEFKATANFEQMQVNGGIFFRRDAKEQCVTFEGEANFTGARFGSHVDFNSAEFAGVTFDAIEIGRDAFFHLVTFGGEARFTGARVRGNAEFDGAVFKARCSFDGMQVDGSAFFRSYDQGRRITFGGESRFLGVRIGGPADFSGADFRARAYFDDFQVCGTGFFRADSQGRQVTFGDVASFLTSIFKSAVLFGGAEFKGNVSFSNTHFLGVVSFHSSEFEALQTEFVGVRFERGAYFDSAKFKGETDFAEAIGFRDVSFLDTEFAGPVSFREASFKVAYFGKPGSEGPRSHLAKKEPYLLHQTRFCCAGSVDLRGFTYDRIYVSLGELFPKIVTIDRQPYTQLEQVLRKTGDDARAGRVYLERRRVERQRMFYERRLLRWAMDWLYKLIARYGIRPYRLFGYALFFVLLGTALFLRPGALRPKDEKKNFTQTGTVSNLPRSVKGNREASTASATDSSFDTFQRALGVSVHQFLPIDVPVGSDWVPAPGWPSGYATVFLRVTGAILVGLGLGSVTGLLRRASP